MLVITEIMPQVKGCLDHSHKWKLPFLSSPFRICTITPEYFKKYDVVQVCSNQSYKFEANSIYISTHWIGHVAVLVSAMVSLTYQVFHEDKTFLGICIHAMFLAASAIMAMIAYCHHLDARAFVQFLNQLLTFEEKYLNEKLSYMEQEYWKHVQYKKAIKVAIAFFRLSFQFASLSFPISLLIFPYAPWKFVPAAILYTLTRLNVTGSGAEMFFVIILQRLISFVYPLIVCIVMLSVQGMLLATISLLASQSSLFFLIILLKR